MKVYHILTHTLEGFYPNLRKNTQEFSELDHTIHRVIKQLKNYDKKAEFEHILLLPSSSIKEKKKIIIHKDGYEVRLIKTFSLGFPFEYSRHLIKEIKLINDGIINIWGTGSFLYDFIAPYFKNKKVITHYMGGHFTWRAFPLSFLKYHIVQNFTLQYSTLFFIQNQLRVELYHRYYGISFDKLLYIPLGINCEDFMLQERARLSEVEILFVGRLEVAKGLKELIQAFGILQIEFPKLKLKIVGHGSQINFIKEMSHKNKSIHYLGQLPYEQLLDQYKNSDIFVLPTHFECFGLVLIEAGASGIPVVSTKTEGPLSIVKDGETGFLGKVGDVSDLVNNLRALIENKDLRVEMGKKAYTWINKNFDRGIIAEKYFTYYRLLDKTNRGT